MKPAGLPERLWRAALPWLLADALLGYLLGAGMARYLGEPFLNDRFLLGILWVWAVQLAAHWLYAYFAQPRRRRDLPAEDRLLNDAPLWAAFATLNLAAVSTVALLQAGALSGGVSLLMLAIVLGALLSAIPPFRLGDTLYRGLVPSIALAGLVPALGFLLQNAPPHRLLTMTTFPLTLLHYAAMLTFEFPSYAEDLRLERPRLLVRLGWQRGMRWIALLILAAYLVLAFALLSGLPRSIALPVFLVFPMGLFVIAYLHRIAEGAKPHWRMLTSLAALTYGLTLYLLTLGFWTR